LIRIIYGIRRNSCSWDTEIIKSQYVPGRLLLYFRKHCNVLSALFVHLFIVYRSVVSAYHKGAECIGMRAFNSTLGDSLFIWMILQTKCAYFTDLWERPLCPSPFVKKPYQFSMPLTSKKMSYKFLLAAFIFYSVHVLCDPMCVSKITPYSNWRFGQISTFTHFSWTEQCPMR